MKYLKSFSGSRGGILRGASLVIVSMAICFSQSRIALAVASPSQVILPVPLVETLPNGLTVAWFLDDRLPLVDLSVFVKAGYRDDPVGKSGTAELASASFDRGVVGMTAQEIAKAIEMMGGSRYFSVNDDGFDIGVHGLASDSEALLDILSRFVVHPTFPEFEVNREKARLLDRWNHIEDYESPVDLVYHRLVTAGTSYGRGNVLSPDELRNVTRSDVLEYYKSNFVPSNSILVVIGKVNKVQFRKKIDTVFGGWKNSAQPLRMQRKFRDSRFGSKAKESTIFLIDRPHLAQAQIRMGSQAPLMNSPGYYPKKVANNLLGELFSGRLNSAVRDKLGLTYSIRSALTYSKDFAEFTVATATQNETVGQLIHRTMDVLKEFKKGPISPQELASAKTYMIGNFSLLNSTLNAVAGRWLTGIIYELSPGYLNEFVPKINEVDLAAVEAAAKNSFDLDHWVTVIAGDAAKIKKSLNEAGFMSVKQVSLSTQK